MISLKITHRLTDIDNEIHAINGKINRFVETGDLKRLIRLRDRLISLQAAIADLKLAEAARKRPNFRHSYAFYDFTERLVQYRHKRFIYE